MPVIHFEAKPYRIGSWTILKLPASASVKLPSRSQVMVKGTVNGYGIYTALEPDGNGGHWLNIDESLQTAIKTVIGDTLKLAIESTKDWPEPDIPADVQAGIVDNAETKDLWKRVTPMARWEWLRWINSTSNAETRNRRIEVSRSKLLNGLRRPCCFNRSMCCVPEVSKSGVLLDPVLAAR